MTGTTVLSFSLLKHATGNMTYHRIVKLLLNLPYEQLFLTNCSRLITILKLKIKCRQYPAIHTNYSCSNYTISY